MFLLVGGIIWNNRKRKSCTIFLFWFSEITVNENPVYTIFLSSTVNRDYRFNTLSTNARPTEEQALEWRLDIEDDDLALEYAEQLNLVYSPRISDLIDRFEAGGQFIRHTVPVFIMDNDSKGFIHIGLA